jgi:prepilin-type N-terminal cleavage/methylation domain-containing protein
VTTSQDRRIHCFSQSGMTLLETMIALAILLIASVGLLSMGMIAMATTENQGHLTARTAEYAQDKMEQLISLAWGDATTDSTLAPMCGPSSSPACNNGTGLKVDCSGSNTPCGSSDPTAPVVGYVDYLDNSGNLLAYTGGAAPSNWFYIRVWQITKLTTNANLKLITVTSRVRREVGAPQGALPQSTLATLKTNPF